MLKNKNQTGPGQAPKYYKQAKDQFQRAMGYYYKSYKNVQKYVVPLEGEKDLKLEDLMFRGIFSQACAALAEAFIREGKTNLNLGKDYRTAELLFEDVNKRIHDHMKDYYLPNILVSLEKYIHFWMLYTDSASHYHYAIHLRKPPREEIGRALGHMEFALVKIRAGLGVYIEKGVHVKLTNAQKEWFKARELNI
jgi:hypothetical protein